MRIITLLILTAFLTVSCCAKLEIEVQNPSSIQYADQTIEIPITKIQTKLAKVPIEELVVFDANGNQIPSQLSSEGLLLFQATIAAGESAKFTISKGTPETYTAQTYARAVPERMDDWAWENNRITFRMYGPALEATGELSNGIDVWVKSTPEMIINQWYAPGVDYHTDHGQGLDCYKVGRTLGAGAMAPIHGDTLCLGRNYIKATLLDVGPVRTTFCLEYAPFRVDSAMITQRRTISLDAWSQFNRITEEFEGDFDTLNAVAGIIIGREGVVKNYPQGLAYSQSNGAKNGVTHTAVIMMQPTTIDTIQNHIAARTVITNSNPRTSYLNGAGWSKGGFATSQDWQTEVENQIIKLNNPLIIKINE